MALGALLAPTAARRDWEEWDRSFQSLRELVQSLHLVEIDLARALARAADLARTAGEGARAKRAYELSIAQFRELGRSDEAAPLLLVLDAIGVC